jgi:phosphatidylglycerol:prolipoprotein diacylglycerol transferase
VLPYVIIGELPFSGRLLVVETYPVAHVLAFATLLFCAYRAAGRGHLDWWKLCLAVVVGVATGLIGSRLLGEINQGQRNLSSILQAAERGYWGGPKAALGGLTLGVTLGLAIARLLGLRILEAADAAASGLAAGGALTRIGCFLNGCCYGRPTTTALGIRFPIGHPGMDELPAGFDALHPTQLYTAGALLLLAVALQRLQPRLKGGQSFSLFALGYASVTLITESLRGDPGRGHVVGMSTASAISVAIIGLVAFTWIARRLTLRMRAVPVGATLSLMVASGSLALPADGHAFSGVEEGMRRLLAGDVRGAAERLSAEDNSLPDGAVLLAQALGATLQGRLEVAEARLREASRHGSVEVRTAGRVALARMLLRSGSDAEAEQLFRAALADAPRSTLADDAALGLVRALRAQGREDEAREVVGQALDRYGRRGYFMTAPPSWSRMWEDLLRGRRRMLARRLRALAHRLGDWPGPEGLLMAARLIVDGHAERRLRKEQRALARNHLGDDGMRAGSRVPAARPVAPPGPAHRSNGARPRPASKRAGASPWWLPSCAWPRSPEGGSRSPAGSSERGLGGH